MPLPFPSPRGAALAVLVATVLAVGCKKSKPDPANDANPAPNPAPAPNVPGAPNSGTPNASGGPQAVWSEVRDTVGGFRVSVPGPNRALNMATAPEEKKRLQMIMFTNIIGPKDKGALVLTYSFVPPAGVPLGSSPDELYAGVLNHEKGAMTFRDVVTKEPIKLGGRAGLRVVSKANNLSPPPKFPDSPETEQRLLEGYKKDVARRQTHLVTTTATRFIVIMIQTEGDPDPAETKTIIDSFAFL